MVTSNGIMPKKVAILIENGFEDSEFKVPYTALKQAKAQVWVLGARMNEEYQGKRGKESVKPDATVTEVRSEDFDAIVIPGGAAPDKIRTNPNAVRLVMNAIAQDKIVAAVCHGPQVLIEADQLRGRQATGFRAIRKDMENAGATYIDESAVVDGNLLTARQPGDLAMFSTILLTRLGLNIEGTSLPDQGDRNFEFWKLAEAWGGSSRLEIVNALNTAITGEHYTLKVFEQYQERAQDTELQVVLSEIIAAKRQNIQLLEQRLGNFNEQVSWQALGSEALATLQGWLQASNDLDILRRALGDIQTGVVDAYHLSIQLTDPITVSVLSQVTENLSNLEMRLSDLYRARLGHDMIPPKPTTFALVS
jgi:protease I